ncbi:biotin/lipoyl-containing protein [Aeropyrum camini]|uniref:Pyruvate/2-oxoglutarate dehydrogenase complex dihydrolipoamide acyltransferase component n=1 Tax=Aeropyrum camini SY1 = JCM 12091 TaxID=1198449 RepID=U3THW0_9CREN|nr:biotin/lipoyl-containing protein [Aeropyrum camini]BAN90944.1 pyruvate/2-oxoglutarate dehydrogenase complex dihydrolipoamide acyltransferase component [Aeropyrum camini SY1 = JCM 12091]
MASESLVRIPLDLWPRRGGWRGKVVKVYKRPGDAVEKGEVLAEVEIEKAVLEIESPVSGRVKSIVGEGEEVTPDTVVAVVEGPGDGGG